MARRKEPSIPNALLDQLLSGADPKSAFDPGGLLDGLKKALAERALNAEMDHHLAGEDGAGNSRNGYGKKIVTTDTGKFELAIPRDRQASFDPQLIAKYQRRFPGFDDKIISMYSRGMSNREIVGHLHDLYGVDVSPDLISAVTDAVLDEVAAGHEEFSLYETGAITRYIDEAFDGPQLQPADPVHRARCNQLISIADNYAYPNLVWGVYVERISKPGRGVPSDEDKFFAALPKARNCLAAMSQLMRDAPWFVGEQLTLADLYAAPMFDYFLMTSEGAELIRQHANLQEWWARMASRPSMDATKPS